LGRPSEAHEPRPRRCDRARGGKRLIEPALADDAFLLDVEKAPAGALHLWWVGQSGFLVKLDDRYLLFDPYLSDSLTAKYERRETPHVRMTRRVIDPARLGFVDVVTSSHGHTDHLDAETLRPLRPRALVCPTGLRELAAERAGVEPHGIDVDESIAVAGFRFTAVHAEHESEGGAVGFVVECGPWTLYHSGDTTAYPGLGERLGSFDPDVAILPINGNLGNMDGRDAARIAKKAGAGLAVPCHFEMFEFNTASPDEFVSECTTLGQPYRVLRAAERLTLAAP
jgi:L-ascorbate metabolism protein UlaG (beta-lactamase superfamily)